MKQQQNKQKQQQHNNPNFTSQVEMLSAVALNDQ